MFVKNIEKQKIRERILTLLRNQKEEKRLEKSLIIGQKLFHLQEFQKASIILFYAAFDGEVDTFNMINQSQSIGKQIGLPTIDCKKKEIIPMLMQHPFTECHRGSYGIREPQKQQSQSLALQDIDLIVVPGLAFDRNNARLGRGGGFYDRFLARVPQDIPTVGIAFDFQILDTLPAIQSHDYPVSRVLNN